jgi:hypothetical protein
MSIVFDNCLMVGDIKVMQGRERRSIPTLTHPLAISWRVMRFGQVFRSLIHLFIYSIPAFSVSSGVAKSVSFAGFKAQRYLFHCT